jgi:murein DD-endopeptidase MepM/ murein hydrolase activator NlpD
MNYIIPFKKRPIKIGQGNNQGSHKYYPKEKADFSYSIDFLLPENTEIIASREGVVTKVKVSGKKNYSEKDSKKGEKAYKKDMNEIEIKHKDKTYASYCHLKNRGSFVKVKNKVKQGQIIGLSGNTGWSSAPHLDFTVFKKDINGLKIKSIKVAFTDLNPMKINSQRLLIALIPKKEIVNNLNKIRKIVGIKAKESSGLRTPHITIVDNSFSNIKEVDKELSKIVKSLKPFNALIKGIDTFIVEKSFKIEKYKENNSLIYRIKNNSHLNNLRKEILRRLDYLKTSERLKQWVKENPKISSKSIKNIKKYGTPFKDWKFHTTIGLIPKQKQGEILNKIKKLDLQKNWKIDCFGLFIRKDGWKLYKKYNFTRK